MSGRTALKSRLTGPSASVVTITGSRDLLGPLDTLGSPCLKPADWQLEFHVQPQLLLAT